MTDRFPELLNPKILCRFIREYDNITKDSLEILLEEIKTKTEEAYVELSKDEFVGMGDTIVIYSGPWKDRILEDTIDLKINKFLLSAKKY